MDHLFTINATPDDTTRLNKTFQSSDILKVGWNEKNDATDDETISVFIDTITEEDSLEIAELVSHEQKKQYKHLRQNIRKYMFTCFTNDGILEIEDDRNIKVEMNNLMKKNGDLNINLKKKKLIKTIEPFHYKDKNRHSKSDVEESRYYNADAEEELDEHELEAKTERQQETSADEKRENDETHNKGEQHKENQQNAFEGFEQMINDIIANEFIAINENAMDYTEKNIPLIYHKEGDSEKQNPHYDYVTHNKFSQSSLEKNVTLDGNESKTEINVDELGTADGVNKTIKEKKNETIKKKTVVQGSNEEKGEKEKTEKDEEKKSEETTKEIMTSVVENNGNATKKNIQTANLKKRKINLVEEGETGTDDNIEEMVKKGKIFQETNDDENDIEKKKKINEKNLSITIQAEFRKKIKEWITFFPDINVENFFFHLYFLVELWKDKKKTCVHCGSTDCEFDENNKSICSNMYCFLCNAKMIEGSPCHNIRNQFTTLRKTSLSFIKNLQRTYPFDQFGASCFTCSSPEHQICGTPPNVEGAKTIDFRAFRMYETSLYNAVYEKNPLFIWDETSKEFQEKVELVKKYIANKRVNNRHNARFPHQREEYETQTRRFPSRVDTGNRGGGNHYFDERYRKNSYDQQRDKKSIEMKRNERINDRNEPNYYIMRRAKNKKFHESQFFNKDNNNKGHNTNKGNIISYSNYKTNAELGYSKNSIKGGSRNMYPMDNSFRRNTNFTNNTDRLDYNNKKNAQHSSTSISVAYNTHGDEQQHMSRKNSFFSNAQNLEHPVKQKKWNLAKELNKKNNFDTSSKSSKYRFFSSNSGKNDQNIYAGLSQKKEINFLSNKNNQDQRQRCQTNFNYSRKHSPPNLQSAPLPIYKNVKPRNDHLYDNFFYKGNKLENNFGKSGTGMENSENKNKGIYKTTQNTGKYKNKQNKEDTHRYNNNNNNNNSSSNNNNNSKSNKIFTSGFHKGTGNDPDSTAATTTITTTAPTNNIHNKNYARKGNSRAQKKENTFRYNINNNTGNNNESFSNNGLNFYRTKSTGNKKI